MIGPKAHLALAASLFIAIVAMAFLPSANGGAFVFSDRIGGATCTVAALLAATLVVISGIGYREQNRVLSSSKDLITRYENSDGCEPDDFPTLNEISEDSPWSVILTRVSKLVTDSFQQTRRAENALTATDVRAHRAAKQAEQCLAILSRLKQGILVVDHYEEIVMANSSCQRILGFELKDNETRSASELIENTQVLEMLTHACGRNSPTTLTREVDVREADGSVCAYRVCVNSLYIDQSCENPDDTVGCGVFAVIQDVSGEKVAQKQIAEFVSAVSHEMKTPLSGIKAYVELLADGDVEDDETRDEFLEVINSQTDRMRRLIDNLLNLARMEAGVVSVSKKAQSLNSTLEEAMRVIRPSAEAKDISIVSDLSDMYLGSLFDKDMILQSAINLLSNAIKYTPDSGTVTIRSRMQGSEVLFEVEDNGVGLSEEDAKRVFEKFYRVKQNQNMASGTGLGLPLAKHIVEDVHGGRLVVNSELGSGSSFSVFLRAAGKIA